MTERVPHLHVCVTCRAGRVLSPGDTTPGRALHDALAARAEGVRVLAVECLSNCERGVSIAISAPGKWGYLMGGLGAEQADDLLVYGAAYAASRTGTVMPSKRPPSLATAVFGRFPAQESL